MTTKSKLGILAYGSLIDEPGQEISEITESRIECVTPFNVEFARKSKTRGYAPTLIPVNSGGSKVNAVILVLKDEIDVENAKSILARREKRDQGRTAIYQEPVDPGVNKLVIKTHPNFMEVETVIYTSFGSNIDQPITGDILADLAIQSIRSKAGRDEMDGLRYLLAAKRNKIITALSEEYENQILSKTETKNLEEAIEKLDRERKMYPLEISQPDIN